MKLVIAGSTGFVATEMIRQGLSNPSITSIVALGRKEIQVPANTAPGADTTKLKSVVVDDFENYSDSVKQATTGADACVWTIAITPSQLRTMGFDQATKICKDYALTGIKTLAALPRDGAAKPLRFIYISGSNAERDQTKKPWILGDYCLMRGAAEAEIIEFAKNSNGKVEAAVAKPGLIDAPGRSSALAGFGKLIMRSLVGLPKVDVSEIAGTLLDQSVNGFEKETLLNEDLVRIGQKYIASQPKAQ